MKGNPFVWLGRAATLVMALALVALDFLLAIFSRLVTLGRDENR